MTERELKEDLDCQSSEDSETSESEMDETKEKNGKKKALKPKKEKPKQQLPFLKDLLGKFFSTNQLLKTIEGRAAKVHSFMRGLSMNKVYPFSPFTSINQDELDFSFSGRGTVYYEIIEINP